MVSDAMLSRVSEAYRRGYRDGYDSNSNLGCNVRPEYIKPFATFDYSEGLKAGWNDAFWASNTLHYLEARTVRAEKLAIFLAERGVK